MSKVIVVGGGVIGYSCALALQDAGANVVMIDSEEAKATSYAAGILFPNGTSRAQGELGELNLRALAMWDSWHARLGGGLRRVEGLLQLTDDTNEADVRRWPTLFTSHGFNARWIDEAEARQIAPLVADDVQINGAVWVPEGGSINPRDLLDAMRLEVFRRAGTVLMSEAAVGLEVLAGRVEGVRLRGGLTLKADWVIAATGLASNGWLPEGARPALTPQMGERARISLPEPLSGVPVIGTPGGSLVPRRTPELWAGVTVRAGDREPRLTVAGGAHVLSNAAKWMPSLAECRVANIGAGVRPLSADGLPFVGGTELEGLVLASGHGRDGILQSPLCAAAVTAFVTEGRLPAWSTATDPRGRTL